MMLGVRAYVSTRSLCPRASSVEIARRKASARPADGPMIVAIDGPGGAGKTTLATSIAALLGPSIVVPTDDFRCPPAYRIRRFLADGDPGWNTTLSASATRFWSQRVVALRPAGSALTGRATCAVQEGPRVRRIWLFLFQEILPTRVKSHLTRFLVYQSPRQCVKTHDLFDCETQKWSIALLIGAQHAPTSL